MRTRIMGVCLVIGATVAAGCGSDEPSGRSRIVDQVVASANSADIEVDEPCVTTIVDQFSAADLAILEKNSMNPDVDAMSPAGQGLIVQLLNCTGGRPGGTIPPAGGLSTTQNLILEQIKAGLDAQGVGYDETCLSDLVNSVDTATLANDAIAADLVAKARACVKQ